MINNRTFLLPSLRKRGRGRGLKMKSMKKSTIIIIAVLALLAIWAVTGYNGLVAMEENVNGQWSNVETQYQRRADLIPNLVNTVKGYASHERETLEGVIEARSKATRITVNAEDLTPEKLAEYQKAQGAVTSALGKLLAITENYPELKANQNFLELQAQLEGTENRINVARTNFNNTAKEFNTSIRRFLYIFPVHINIFQNLQKRLYLLRCIRQFQYAAQIRGRSSCGFFNI